MTNNDIKNMLADLIEEIDYDIYKEIFVHNDDDDYINKLVDIVKSHLI